MFVLQKLIMAKSVVFTYLFTVCSNQTSTTEAFHSIYLFIFTDENEKEKKREEEWNFESLCLPCGG